MTRLGTTTWKNRSNDQLVLAKEKAQSMGMRNPLIIEYGPGGIIGFMFTLMLEGPRSKLQGRKKLQRIIIRKIETGMRRLQLFKLRTSEPFEIASIFGELEPKELCIVEREEKVMKAVKHLLSCNDFGIPVRCLLMDVQNGGPGHQADIVIAQYVIERARNEPLMFEHMAASVKPGGLLLTTYEGVTDAFSVIAPGLYLKKPC